MASNQNSQNVINWVRRRKGNLIKVFHSQCCICGFDAYQEALEFHHVNPEEKEFAITGSDSVTKALDKQLIELKKCILVCSNCHKGIHAGYLDVPEDWKNLYDDDVAKELLDNLDEIKHGKRHYCKRCGVEVSASKVTYCPQCFQFMQRVVKWPSREELKQMIRTQSFTSIADQYHVTDNAIRKWCDAYDLPRRVKDIKQYSDEEWERL